MSHSEANVYARLFIARVERGGARGAQKDWGFTWNHEFEAGQFFFKRPRSTHEMTGEFYSPFAKCSPVNLGKCSNFTVAQWPTMLMVWKMLGHSINVWVVIVMCPVYYSASTYT